MEFIRITDIQDPLFAKMHRMMQQVFPPQEVLEFSLWADPLKDESIYVYVAVHEDDVVGTTEYRYYPDFNVAMTDFTIIGRAGLGIGRFLATKRQEHLFRLAKAAGNELSGMFAEIYDPYRADHHPFGGIKTMDPYVRREVLSHLGYCKLDVDYVHPSWENNGEAVEGLDLCFLPYAGQQQLPAELVVSFLTTYYTVLPDKPAQWLGMIDKLRSQQSIKLLPI